MNRSASRFVYPDLGLLLIRVMVGIVGMFHGAQKLFGVFDGPGIDGFAEWLGKMNIPMPQVNAYLAGGAEFFGGLFLAIGFFPRLASIPFIVTMLVASFHVHGGAFSAGKNGMEYPLTLAVVMIGLLLTGPGRLTVMEAVWGRRGTRGGEAR